MGRLPGLGIARNIVALVLLVALVGIALLAYVRPGGPGGEATPGSSPVAGTTPTPPGAASPTPARPATPTPAPDEAVVEFTNPDGIDPSDHAPDEYPFVEQARALPTFAGIWVDANQRDFHVAVTDDIDGAIAALRSGIPRGITVFFHRVGSTYADLEILAERVFADREELAGKGILVMSGGVWEREGEVRIEIAPLNPETRRYLVERYPGRIVFEDGGHGALRRFEPPAFDDVRLSAVSREAFSQLLTCGRRPFGPGALVAAPADIDGGGPELKALRESLAAYAEVYGDLTELDWILVEHDQYGATFVADRGDAFMEAPVYASTDDWAPGTIDYCVPRPLTPQDGGDAVLWFDPAFPAPGPDSIELHVLVGEQACSGARPPASRLLPPIVEQEPAKLSVHVRVRPVGGAATCPGNAPQPITIVLPEPLGDRELAGIGEPPDYY